MMQNIKLSIILLIISLVAIALLSDFRAYIVLQLNEHMNLIKHYSSEYPVRVELIFFIMYVIFASLSIPVALVLGLLSGMIFDIKTAILIVSFASSIGATFAFLISRYLFRDYLIKKYNKQYIRINEGIKKNSEYYIFALRMCMIFPFFLVNLILGLTTIKTINYYLISQIGMLPGTIIIIILGDKLASTLTSTVSIDPGILILLTLLGLLPLVSRILFKKVIS